MKSKDKIKVKFSDSDVAFIKRNLAATSRGDGVIYFMPFVFVQDAGDLTFTIQKISGLPKEDLLDVLNSFMTSNL